jgi:ring-1,2-phenylacetyl-CoA epoxidase subunit PaaD
VLEAISNIPDPEIPVITIADLGILRDVVVDEAARRVQVTITPTYSGCPAMTAIERHIAHRAASLGYTAAITTQLSPAWTTDWMSERGRARLREFGIAPPQPRSGSGAGPVGGPVDLALTVRQVSCPQCGSEDTEELSRFGTTACKALRRCRACGEPFDEFKAL